MPSFVDSPSSIDVSFRYSESDYVRAMRSHYASRLRLPLDIAAILVTLAAGIYFWRSSDNHWYAILLIGVSLIFALMLVAAFLVIPSFAFRREPKFRDEYQLRFSAEGIHFRTQHIDSQLQWDMYTRALITRNSYVLYYGAHSFTVIPSRVFQTETQRESFEHLISQKIQKVVRKD